MVVVVASTGLALFLFALMPMLGIRWVPPSPPALIIGVVLLEYAASLARRHLSPTGLSDAVVGSHVELRRGLVSALVVVAAFWWVTGLAEQQGQQRAAVEARLLAERHQAVVYSVTDLYLPDGYGIGRAALGTESSGYRHRYNGLRPLLRSNDRWFLLPVGWTHENGATVIVLEDNPGGLRVDLAPSSRPSR